MMKSNWKWCWK